MCVRTCPINTKANDQNYSCEKIKYDMKDNVTLIWACSLSFVSIYGASILMKKMFLKRKMNMK